MKCSAISSRVCERSEPTPLSSTPTQRCRRPRHRLVPSTSPPGFVLCAWTSWGARHGRSGRAPAPTYTFTCRSLPPRRRSDDANVPRLFADMLRYARPDGVVIDMPVPTAPGAIVADRPENIRARRAALNPNPAGRSGTAWSCGLSRGSCHRSATAPDAGHGRSLPDHPTGPISACCRRARMSGRSRRWQVACGPKAGCGPMCRAALPSLCRLSRSDRSRRCGKHSARVPRPSPCARRRRCCRLRRRLRPPFPPPPIRIGPRPRLGDGSHHD